MGPIVERFDDLDLSRRVRLYGRIGLYHDYSDVVDGLLYPYFTPSPNEPPRGPKPCRM